MAQVSKGKRTFWLTDSLQGEHQKRAEQLSLLGYDVSFLKNMREALDSLGTIRPTCILIDANITNQQSIAKSIEKLNQHPELSGTKFILSMHGQAPEAAKAAASENFRDIIPFELSNERWLQRFKHATSPKPVDLGRPLCEITMNQMAMAYAPARVVWISESHIRIECRGGQTIGSNLQITGSLANALGSPYISLTVESVHRNELLYRFSQALVCRWRVPEAQMEAAKITVRRAMSAHPSQANRFRAFVAISSAETRHALSQDLSRDQFEVKVALLRSTIAQELSFFSPDIIFFDQKIISSLEEIDLQLIASKLERDVKIVIFGTDEDTSDTTRIFTKQKIHIEPVYDTKKASSAVSSYELRSNGKVMEHSERRIHILPDQPWSRVELQMPARLTALNPAVGQISLPFSVAAFASIRLEAPILRKSLGRASYIRVLSNTEVASKTTPSQFAHHGSFYLADVTPAESAILSQVLLTMTNNYYQKQFIESSIQLEMLKITQNELQQAAGFTSSAGITDTAGDPGRFTTEEKISSAQQKITAQPKPFHKSARYAQPFKISDYLDPVLAKAVLVFIIAMSIVLGLLSLASKIDPSFYKDHGRQYSDFFLRMSDPEFREKNPPKPPGSSRGRDQ